MTQSQYPKKKITIQQMQNLHTPSELERIELKFVKLMYHAQTEQIIVLLEGNNKTIAQPLSEFEGSMASFVFLGCAENAHIITIHQMYIALLKETGATLDSIIIESKQGDMFYATLEFTDINNKKIRTMSSLGDALILGHLTKSKIYILRKVLDIVEDFNDWTYYHEIIDDDLD